MCKKQNVSLKEISSRVVEELERGGCVEYQALCSRLIDEMGWEGNGGTNLRRRVYDALNVMIAIGLVVKRGKGIVLQSRKSRKSVVRLEQWQFSILEGKRDSLSSCIESKRAYLRSLESKEKRLRQLIEINHGRLDERRYSFPLIGVYADVNEEVILKRGGDGQSLQILSSNQLQVEGDLDLLMHLRLNGQNESNAQQQ